MDIKEVIKNLDEETKNALSIEIGLFEDGTISEEQMENVLKRHESNKQKQEELIKKENIKRNMKNLVILLNKNPQLLSNIKAIIDYRNLRVEQRVYDIMLQDAKKTEGRDADFLNLDAMEQKTYSLDKRRREVHNRALSNFSSLIKSFNINGLQSIYNNDLMDPSDAKDGYGEHLIRQKMTDGMLSILANIEDLNINELNLDTEEYDKGLGTFSEIHASLNKQTREWGGRIIEDDGDLVK